MTKKTCKIRADDNYVFMFFTSENTLHAWYEVISGSFSALSGIPEIRRNPEF